MRILLSLVLLVALSTSTLAAMPPLFRLRMSMTTDSALAVVGTAGRRDTSWHDRERQHIRAISIDAVALYGVPGSMSLGFSKWGRLTGLGWTSNPTAIDSDEERTRVRDSIAAHFGRAPKETAPGMFLWESPVLRYTLVTNRSLFVYVAAIEE
jgi:hypothetical protein